MKYLICYDLVSSEPDQDPITEALKNMGAKRILESVWLYEEFGIRDNTDKLQNHLRDFLHRDLDELFVVRLVRNTSIRTVRKIG